MKQLVSGHFSSIPLATLITATMDMEAQSEADEAEDSTPEAADAEEPVV